VKRVAILGGTGQLGSGLASRISKAADYEVILGSRNPERGMPYREAVGQADLVILAVPFAHHSAILNELREALAGKLLVDATVPLVPPKVARVQLPPQGSAALAAQQILGDEVRIVSAFQNVSAELLQLEGPIDCDVLVSGDDPDARAEVIELAQVIGLSALHAGPLANSVAAEALTSILIFLNRRHGGHSGLRITGLKK
jgi:8-hydroxy-5-deazaflavin:NADPH oxidoreductase